MNPVLRRASRREKVDLGNTVGIELAFRNVELDDVLTSTGEGNATPIAWGSGEEDVVRQRPLDEGIGRGGGDSEDAIVGALNASIGLGVRDVVRDGGGRSGGSCIT